MRRLALVVALVAVAVMAMGASVAWGDDAIWAVCTSGGYSATCDTTAWYQAPVSVIWTATGEGTTSGPTSTSPCDLGVQYVYNTDAVTNLSCSATWSDGTDKGDGFNLHVEATSPTVTAIASRPPDLNGWYNHPFTVSFQGTNSFSGIASCTPPAAYAGPASGGAALGGSCTDKAGKTVTASFGFAYDATAPALAATADPGDQSVALSWQAGGDVAPIASVQVTRSGGTSPAGVATVYSGTGTSFNDTRLKNGAHYTYTITARDLAGNATVQTIGATPQARLLSPAVNAHLSAPPMLSWTAAPSATYYNVQLFRSGGKVLSMWPKHASLQLRRAWKFQGRRYRLKPGRYKWYVWPGLGRRKAGRYGRMIGSGTFVVVR